MTFSLVQHEGTLQEDYETEDWYYYLKRKFSPAGIVVNGYNFNNEIGVHTVRLLCSELDVETFQEHKVTVENILDGTEELPDCAPSNIDLSRSRMYKHVNDLFDEFRNANFEINGKVVYGDNRMWNRYLESQQS